MNTRTPKYILLRIAVVGMVASLLAATAGAHTPISHAQRGTGVVRVAPWGQNDQSCGSEQNPCRTVQYGARRALSGDTVLVAEGVYTYDAASAPTTPCPDFGVTSAVVCVNGKDLTILGGYSGSDWTAADPARYPTVIDGQNQYRGMSLQNGTYRVEGFIIKDGLAQGAPSGTELAIHAYGGGMSATLAPITLRNMIFRYNQARGGNTNLEYGGSAVGAALAFNNFGTTPYNVWLDNVVFENNSAIGGTGVQRGGNAIGGAMHAYRVYVTGRRLTFTGNMAQSGSSNGSGLGGYIYSDAQGGAVSIYNDSVGDFQYVTATGNQVFGGNTPNGTSGAAFGGAFYVEHANVALRDAELRDNLVQGGDGANTAAGAGGLAEGGAFHSDDGNITLERVTIINNTVRGGKGTVYKGPAGGGGASFTGIESSNFTINVNNSIIADNRVQLATTGQLQGGGGGGLWLQGLTVNLTHSTLARNTVDSGLVGSGIVVIGPYGPAAGTTVNANYLIIADHTGGSGAVYVQAGSTINLKRGLWSNNTLNTNSGGYAAGTINGLGTMLSGAARFASPGAPDYNYHILGNSAARNQAVDSDDQVDVDVESRTDFAPADIGADEYIPFVFGAAPTGSGRITLSWLTNDLLAASTHHYVITVVTPPGATPPAQGSTINVGLKSTLTLTGLTNGREYVFTLAAYNSSNTLLDSSNATPATPYPYAVRLPGTYR